MPPLSEMIFNAMFYAVLFMIVILIIVVGTLGLVRMHQKDMKENNPIKEEGYGKD